MVGGTPIKKKIYWSSSELNAWASWYVYFDSGGVGNWSNECAGNYVRPCTAFKLEKKGGAK